MKELIDNKELVIALEELEKEKGIKKDYVIEAIETALVTAYKRNFDAAENVKVVMDKVTGATHIYSCKEVVETLEDSNIQISLEEAKKVNKKAKVGETVDIELAPKNFGRIAAQTAKQVIIQKLREVERDVLYNEFNDRQGEIVSGIITCLAVCAAILPQFFGASSISTVSPTFAFLFTFLASSKEICKLEFSITSETSLVE